ncbi:PDZ domain-containing protein [Pseudoscourfieldia marina]
MLCRSARGTALGRRAGRVHSVRWCLQRQSAPGGAPGGAHCGGLACLPASAEAATSVDVAEAVTASVIEIEEIDDLEQRYGAVVKLHVTSQRPDWLNPWQKRTAERSIGSGVLIKQAGKAWDDSGFRLTKDESGKPTANEQGFPDDHIFLTAAHVVADCTFVEVQMSNMTERHRGRVISVLHQADLALVAVRRNDDGTEEPDAFMNVEPLTIAPRDYLPPLRTPIHVVGFPVGGDELSVTEGVVSRVEVQTYSHGTSRALALTVDAAINSGNSGGPLIDVITGTILGVAFQSYAGTSYAENQGHAVPSSLCQRFVNAALCLGNDESMLAMPVLGVSLQLLQNNSLRTMIGLTKSPKDVGKNETYLPGNVGVLVADVEQGSSVDELVRPGDILVELDGLPIASDSSVSYMDKKLEMVTYLHGKYAGDVVKVKLLRGDGQAGLEEKTFDIELKRHVPLVQRSQYDVKPSFVIYGGLLFQPLSLDFLHCWGRDLKDAPAGLQQEFFYGVRRGGREEIVVLSQILSDEANTGYTFDSIGLEVVQAVNGVDVYSMSGFVECMDNAYQAYVDAPSRDTRFVRVELARGSTLSGATPYLVVLDVSDLAESAERVSERYGVSRDRSPELPDGKW